MSWRHTTKVKHLLSDETLTDEAVQQLGVKLADLLDRDSAWNYFSTGNMRRLPESNEFFTTEDCFNRELDRMYDYADRNRIWIE